RNSCAWTSARAINGCGRLSPGVLLPVNIDLAFSALGYSSFDGRYLWRSLGHAYRDLLGEFRYLSIVVARAHRHINMHASRPRCFRISVELQVLQHISHNERNL